MPHSAGQWAFSGGKKDGNDKKAEEYLNTYFKPIEGHDWYFSGLSKEQIDKVREGYEKRYGKAAAGAVE